MNVDEMSSTQWCGHLHPFFQISYKRLVESPNGSEIWWHSMPLPDGSRINGYDPDKDRQFKMWNAMQIGNNGGLSGKRVLDIGANDGFFTLAALAADAQEVTAMDMDWATWPKNIIYASDVWKLRPKIVSADFRRYSFGERYDVIFFLGVLYHVQDVFTCMDQLCQLLEENGAIYLETQMTRIESDLPIFEYASDIFGTVSRQDKASLGKVGISNYLFPNESALKNLAYSYGLELVELLGPKSLYSAENPSRKICKLVKRHGR